MLIRRYLFLSFVIHFAALAIWVKAHPQSSNQAPESSSNQKQQRATKKREFPGSIIDIVPQYNQGLKPKKELKNFFWGIGVTCNQLFEHYPNGLFWVIKVNIVHQGYSAEEAGLVPGDEIYLIDNKPITVENEIAGKQPRKMVLTILRGNSTLIKSVERVKVYF